MPKKSKYLLTFSLLFVLSSPVMAQSACGLLLSKKPTELPDEESVLNCREEQIEELNPLVHLSDDDDHRDCAHTGIINRSENILEVAALEERIQLREQILDQQKNGGAMLSEIEQLHTIPVVFHIMHTGEPYGIGANIPDERIFAAMEDLNHGFAGTIDLNQDGIPDGNMVDTKMRFALAKRDPQGNSTNGIVRVDASSVTDFVEFGINAPGKVGASEGAVKALSTWPNTQYVNIWVVPQIAGNGGGNGVQGYAYFPTTNVKDGIVILANKILGVNAHVGFSNNDSDTLLHEMGHVFALYHTFHLTSTCNPEVNCLTQGDRVCDTPVTPKGGNCNSPQCNGTQQVENWLDYTANSCRTLFTLGQKTRMRNALENERTSLLSSLGAIPVTQNDIAVTQITGFNNYHCQQQAISPKVVIANYGAQTISQFQLSYGAGQLQSQTFSQEIAPGSTITINLPTIALSNSHSQFSATANLIGTVDDDSSNNSKVVNFEVDQANLLSVQINVDFMGHETTWNIQDQGLTYASGGPYPNTVQGTSFQQDVCVPNGCYDFNIYDSNGDGQGLTNGSYNLFASNGSVLATGSGNWGSQQSHNVCVNSNDTNPPPVCIQSHAPNFNFTNSSLAVNAGNSINASVSIATSNNNTCASLYQLQLVSGAVPGINISGLNQFSINPGFSANQTFAINTTQNLSPGSYNLVFRVHHLDGNNFSSNKSLTLVVNDNSTVVIQDPPEDPSDDPTGTPIDLPQAGDPIEKTTSADNINPNEAVAVTLQAPSLGALGGCSAQAGTGSSGPESLGAWWLALLWLIRRRY